MHNIEPITYKSLDELSELYPDAAAYIVSIFKDYHGGVYKFLYLDDFAIYELTEGSCKDVINFDSPGIRPINLENTINFYELGSNMLEAGLINVTYYKGCVYVLHDLK